jgi:hypothetical protein
MGIKEPTSLSTLLFYFIVVVRLVCFVFSAGDQTQGLQQGSTNHWAKSIPDPYNRSSTGCEVVSHCGFDLRFPNDW